MAKDYNRSDFEAFYDSAIEDIPEEEIRDELLKAKKHVIDLAMIEVEVFLAGFKQLCYINPLTLSFEMVNCIYPNAEDIQRQVAESLAALVLVIFLIRYSKTKSTKYILKYLLKSETDILNYGGLNL